MKKLSLLIIFILMFSATCLAKYVLAPLNERIEKSDLIVIGTLTLVKEEKGQIIKKDFTVPGTTGKGIIVVEEVLAGEALTQEGKKLKQFDRLLMDWYAIIACDIGWHKDKANKKGIWLLKIEDGGIVSSRDFVYLDELNEVKNILEKTNLKSHIKRIWTQNSEKINIKELDRIIHSNNKSYFTIDSLLRALLVLIIALILYRLLYRARFKIKLRKEKKEKKE